MSQSGKCELDVYFAKSPGTLFFSLVIVDKKHFVLCLHVTLCSVTKSSEFQLWMNLFGSFHFASLNTVQTKARNK